MDNGARLPTRLTLIKVFLCSGHCLNKVNAYKYTKSLNSELLGIKIAIISVV